MLSALLCNDFIIILSAVLKLFRIQLKVFFRLFLGITFVIYYSKHKIAKPLLTFNIHQKTCFLHIRCVQTVLMFVFLSYMLIMFIWKVNELKNVKTCI